MVMTAMIVMLVIDDYTLMTIVVAAGAASHVSV
jgi:hypothetical protein